LKKAILALMLILPAATPAMALNARVAGELQKLEPEEELEQRCDIEALNRISAADNGMFADKVIAYTFAPPAVEGTSIDAKGAAFRAGGHWYRLSYHCVTDPTELDVKAFSFKIGAEIPRAQWDRLYLYP